MIWAVYSISILHIKFTKAKDELAKLKVRMAEHELLPHFQSTQLFQKIYANALEGRIKSIDEVTLDFSPYQMRKLIKAIEKNHPTIRSPELQKSS